MRKHQILPPKFRQIIEIIEKNKEWTLTSEILSALKKQGQEVSDVTVRRRLSELTEQGYLERQGQGRATRYRMHPAQVLILPMDEDGYFTLSVSERPGQRRFNLEIFNLLKEVSLFTSDELDYLFSLETEFLAQKERLSPTLIKKELERLIIEFSWKSSAIEGNTYDLLETETLLKEGLPSEGKSPEETQMILNHKSAFLFVYEHLEEFQTLSLAKIETLHTKLVENLGVTTNLRKSLVAITGSVYKPLDNEFQIRECIEKTCDLINQQESPFAKALLSVLLISYIQPFEDGNKRTARLLANAALMAHNSVPLSFRDVRVDEYKKAILLFYELNYLPAFKRIFIDQVKFSATNYFQSRA